jgi:hypothetical protein
MRRVVFGHINAKIKNIQEHGHTLAGGMPQPAFSGNGLDLRPYKL